jgi:carboxymethylenebutenolidase
MMGEHVTVRAADGNELDLYVARPEGEPIGGLVVVQEICGSNAHMRSVTDGFARDGFWAVAPAMFDRFEKGVDLGYSKEDRQAAMAFVPKLDPIVSLADVEAAVEFARAESGGKVGVVGYCFGGSMAWLAATRLNVAAAVGYYGGHIGHFAGEKVKAPVMLHFGKLDAHIPASVGESVQAGNPEVEVYWYEAGHGFNRDVDSHVYAPEAAALARDRTVEFLKKNLG